MKNQMKVFARIKICSFLLVALCSFTKGLPSAQKDRPGDIPAGYTLIDGDILMPTPFVNSLRDKTQRLPRVRATTYITNLWPNGIVPFEFDDNCAPGSTTCVMAANQTAMLNAMAVLENVANLDFQQCPNNDCNGNYVHIQNSTGNNSAVGMRGGRQIINILNWGNQFRMVHELMHCLGFFHEHTRPDRNRFVEINCDNVQGGCDGNVFNRNFEVPDDAAQWGDYDFDSVMHYDECAFSIDCAAGQTCACTNTTITVLPPNDAHWQSAIGQRNHLSDLDEATVSFLYPFANWRFFDCDYKGSNGASNGTFRRPYTTFTTALANTPEGGTLWILSSCSLKAAGTYNKRITVRVGPGAIATLGS